MGIKCSLHGSFHGITAAHISALRADEHSAFRVVPVIDERVAFPVTRDEVTSESVFQVAGIVQGVVKTDDEPAAGALRGLVAFPVPTVVDVYKRQAWS